MIYAVWHCMLRDEIMAPYRGSAVLCTVAATAHCQQESSPSWAMEPYDCEVAAMMCWRLLVGVCHTLCAAVAPSEEWKAAPDFKAA